MKNIFWVGMSRVAIMLSICLILGGFLNYAYKHAYKKISVYQSFVFTTVKFVSAIS